MVQDQLEKKQEIEQVVKDYLKRHQPEQRNVFVQVTARTEEAQSKKSKQSTRRNGNKRSSRKSVKASRIEPNYGVKVHKSEKNLHQRVMVVPHESDSRIEQSN